MVRSVGAVKRKIVSATTPAVSLVKTSVSTKKRMNKSHFLKTKRTCAPCAEFWERTSMEAPTLAAASVRKYV